MSPHPFTDGFGSSPHFDAGRPEIRPLLPPEVRRDMRQHLFSPDCAPFGPGAYMPEFCSVFEDSPVNIQGVIDRGTARHPHEGMLAVDRRRGMPQLNEIHDWSHNPWDAYPYMRERTDLLTPEGQAALAPLADWYNSPDPLRWELENPVRADEARTTARRFASSAQQGQEVMYNTRRQMEAVKSANWVERGIKGTWEYVAKDFKLHPAASILTVIAGYMGYRFLKGTPAGKWLGIGALGTVGYYFLRDKFGFRPGEKVAKLAGIFSPGAEQTVRNGLNTIKRGFKYAASPDGTVEHEGAGSASGYYLEAMNIQDDVEKALFLALLEENPATFFEWYESTSGGARTRELPPKVREVIQRMKRNDYLPSRYYDLESQKEIPNILRNTAEKMFGYLGRNADTKDGMRDPIGYVRDRYVNGMYYTSLYGRIDDQIRTAMANPECPPQMRTTMQRVIAAHTYDGQKMKSMIQGASGGMDFLDVLLAEEKDMEALAKYNGPGSDIYEVWNYIKHKSNQAYVAIHNGGHAAIDWVRDNVPKWLEWFDRKRVELGITKEGYNQWYNDTFLPWYHQAKARGYATMDDYVFNTPVGRLFKESAVFLGAGAYDGARLTGQGMDWIAERAREGVERMHADVDGGFVIQKMRDAGVSTEFAAWANNFDAIFQAEMVTAGKDVAQFPGDARIFQVLKDFGVLKSITGDYISREEADRMRVIINAMKSRGLI